MSDETFIRAVPPSRRGRKELRTPNPEVRARLLDAANELIQEEGFPGLRIEHVTRRAELSVGTFYLYFKSKDDLFTGLVVRHTERLRRQCQLAYSGAGPVMERLGRGLEAYLDFVEQNEKAFLYFRNSGTCETTAGSLTSWAFAQHAVDLVPLLEEGMRTQEIREEDPVLLTQVILSAMQHLAGFWLEDRARYSRQDIVDFLSRTTVRLLGHRRSSL